MTFHQLSEREMRLTSDTNCRSDVCERADSFVTLFPLFPVDTRRRRRDTRFSKTHKEFLRVLRDEVSDLSAVCFELKRCKSRGVVTDTQSGEPVTSAASLFDVFRCFCMKMGATQNDLKAKSSQSLENKLNGSFIVCLI